MTEHNLPWVYRPHQFDDWGWIRDANGNLAAIGKGDYQGKSHDEHRRDKTDPYGDYAALIVKCVNNHDALVSALKNVQALISEAAMTGFNCKDGDWAERLFASQQKTSAALRSVSAVGDVGMTNG